jgi:acyl-CoA thioester hydrolase
VSERPPIPTRADFAAFRGVTTRWMDNDAYGHVNNVVYYSWFDTAVNAHLVEQGALDPAAGDVVGVVVETGCRYHAPISFPEPVEIGLRVERVGKTSVAYALGVFRAGEERAAADGRFVHVYVERAAMRPVPVPEAVRRAVLPLAADRP